MRSRRLRRLLHRFPPPPRLGVRALDWLSARTRLGSDLRQCFRERAFSAFRICPRVCRAENSLAPGYGHDPDRDSHPEVGKALDFRQEEREVCVDETKHDAGDEAEVDEEAGLPRYAPILAED